MFPCASCFNWILEGTTEMFLQPLVLLGLSLALTATALPMPKAENGKNWVVIVAGSNGWYNYRHQVRQETILGGTTTKANSSSLKW